ncbi:hypothetical protein ALC56_05517 [Trachymyrmex septentrionalis]|uniref:Uncharacterized protein n=1 Tax=Trachymyrmex septentrionalis TaxID=34720 RepID=A0A151JYD2_9HYME|nr:hypothetical protein ALC56_05517 [Trachymyrmex septentrionalis]
MLREKSTCPYESRPLPKRRDKKTANTTVIAVYKLCRKASSFDELRQKETERKQFVVCPLQNSQTCCDDVFLEHFSKMFKSKISQDRRPDGSRSIYGTPDNVCTTTLSSNADDGSTVRHPSDSFETPNSTINCPRRKVFGIEKVLAKLLPPLDADGHSDFRWTYRANTDRTSAKRAFHSAVNKNTLNPK